MYLSVATIIGILIGSITSSIIRKRNEKQLIEYYENIIRQLKD